MYDSCIPRLRCCCLPSRAMDAKIPGMASGIPVADYCGWALTIGVRYEASHALVGLKR